MKTISKETYNKAIALGWPPKRQINSNTVGKWTLKEFNIAIVLISSGFKCEWYIYQLNNLPKDITDIAREQFAWDSLIRGHSTIIANGTIQEYGQDLDETELEAHNRAFTFLIDHITTQVELIKKQVDLIKKVVEKSK